MATVASQAADQCADMLQKLTLDSQAKGSEIPESKKAAVYQYGGSSQGKPEIGQSSQGTKLRALTSHESHNTVAPAGSAKACSDTLFSDGAGAKDGNKEMANGKRIVGFDGHGSYTEKDSGNSKEEKGVAPINEVPQANDADVGLIEIPDSEREITQTEAGEHAFESDEDLPNYSDIEAMILDMDLDPDDQDNFDLEVSMYQSQDMKRTIIRLKQAAYSYMQRAIASHRALAVLYGSYSKHYIKKPEVLVARSTEYHIFCFNFLRNLILIFVIFVIIFVININLI